MSKLTPFKLFCMQNFPFIEADYDAVTDWQLLQQIGSQCKALTDAVIQIQGYLENLDLQDEVNNKLDEMAESGELTDIIAQYLELQGILAYNTLYDLTHAENIADGSFTITFGKDTFNDGHGEYYKIRTIENTDVVDGDNLVAIVSDESLVAEKIIKKLNKYMYTDFE